MPGLLDLAPSQKTVTIGTTAVPVKGVSAKGIVYIMGRFPEARMLMTGKAVDVTPESLMKLAPEALAAIIAAGLGFPGDEAQEDAAAALPLEAQVDLIEAIAAVTMPKGVAPFVDRLTKLMGGVESGINQVSARHSSTAGMKSPRQSKA